MTNGSSDATNVNAIASTECIAGAEAILSSLNPLASQFVPSSSYQNETDEIVEDEFYDCKDDNIDNIDTDDDTVNAVTRRQARQAEQTAADTVQGPLSTHATAQSVPIQTHDNTVDRPDCVSTHNTDTENNTTELDNFELHIDPKDFLDDSEFSAMYRFKAEGTIPENPATERTIMLTADMFTIDDTDNRLYRIYTPRAKREQRVKPLLKVLCLPLKFQYYIVDSIHRMLSHPSTERLYLTLK
jgi:hypothetical protein